MSIRFAEVDVILVGLEVLGNSSLEYIASKKSATSSSWSYFRSLSSTKLVLKVLKENDY